MGIKMKLYISLASTILFMVAVVIFFFNNNPIKWFWFCILLGSIIQNIVLFKKYKEIH
ncbi:membrane protein [Bacillus sp. LK2]|nr:membrane protein [Bacillus sp. LK2]